MPLSPSSALQTMYFCAACVSCTVCHLMPVGEASAAAPAQARIGHLLDDVERRHRDGVLQALEAAMGAIVVERQRVDDAAAREGEAGLFGQEGELFRDRRARANDRRPTGNRDRKREATSCAVTGP